MTDSHPFVSVIVPCRNERSHIVSFFDSLLSQDYPSERLEVLVADGQSDDGTRELLDTYQTYHPMLRIIDNKGKIVSIGLNLAVREGMGEIIVRMDVHTQYAPDYIRKCVKVLEETGVENVGGPARTKAEGYLQEAIQLAYHSCVSVGGARFHDVRYEGYVDTVTYGCWKKKTLEKIGLFDEELVRNQDDELNLRLLRSGGKIWQSPEIMSWYFPRDSLSALFRQYMQYGYWKVRVIQKHKVPASLRHLVPGCFVGSLIFLALAAPLSETAFTFWIGLVGLYVLSNLIGSIVTCRSLSTYKYLPVMPLVFTSYHFGYGYGFLRGIIDFLIIRKTARHVLSSITRD